MTTELVRDDALPAAATAVLDAVPRELLVGGTWRPAGSGATFDVEDPATGASLGPVADATADDAMAALDAAAAAQEAWATTEPRVRGDVLRRAFELMTERSEELALLISLEMGKSLVEARAEV